MSVLRAFQATDLFSFNNINLDFWTETFSISFYLTYLSRWPDLCYMQETPNGRSMGYAIGKAEGSQVDWHGHVTAITVAPEFRRLSLARNMMNALERMSDEVYKGLFVDLFVRISNQIAIDMYEGMGYSVYRRIQQYYGGINGSPDEDAYDMRKPMSRDPHRRTVRQNGRDIVTTAKNITM
ncbi:N-acetyltransferase [Cantharellus anzutake]|uniref:N-acetyltransferase n=1 Tax=Cantharellus anzutake TaxID=1750568 RepID=UPI001905D150|nr:N-acetyltransferase [Cantharellus anzutake]KAF8329723.1 N-acetyltransferase [Cantharellus anzutake]